MTREEYVNKACSYIKDTPYPNPNEFTKWYLGFDYACAWCGIFVYYVMKHDLGCDMLDSCSNPAHVPTLVNWAKEKGYFSNSGQKGDLVIYDWTVDNNIKYQHVGIVCENPKNYVISVDGNTANDDYDHDCVAKRKRNLKYVAGYINLPYEEEKMKYKIGDKVVINGDLFYSSSSSLPIGKVVDKVTNITRIAEGKPHPYNTTGDLGWMNECDIKPYEEPVIDYKELYEKELLINKDLKLQNEQLQEINKELEKRIFSAIEILSK